VRGNGTVFFSSRLEPWSETYNYQHPGFDPLQEAIRVAHRHNMALHAWINGECGRLFLVRVSFCPNPVAFLRFMGLFVRWFRVVVSARHVFQFFTGQKLEGI
jgi:hypothetical protein